MNASGFARRVTVWLALPVMLACAATWSLRPEAWAPRSHAGTREQRVYSYRQWQSTGVRVQPGDRVSIRAWGEWSYSPEVGLHGPEGGLPSPPEYPLEYALGGALLGRIGEYGPALVVGRRTTLHAQIPGLLYLRINDDLLGDNRGDLRWEIEVVPGAPPRP